MQHTLPTEPRDRAHAPARRRDARALDVKASPVGRAMEPLAAFQVGAAPAIGSLIAPGTCCGWRDCAASRGRAPGAAARSRSAFTLPPGAIRGPPPRLAGLALPHRPGWRGGHERQERHLVPGDAAAVRAGVRGRAAGRRGAGAVPRGGAAAQAAAAVRPGGGAPGRQGGGQPQLADAGLHSARGAARGSGEPRLRQRAAWALLANGRPGAVPARSRPGSRKAWDACCCSSSSSSSSSQAHAPPAACCRSTSPTPRRPSPAWQSTSQSSASQVCAGCWVLGAGCWVLGAGCHCQRLTWQQQ